MEDSKDTPPSEQKPSEAEKKPAVPAAPPPPRPPAAAPAAPAAPPPPRPAPIPPRPPTASPVPPPSAPKPAGRRTFLRALVTISAVLSIIPFVPWEKFLLSSVSSTGAPARQKVSLDMNTTANNNVNGDLAGKVVNVKATDAFGNLLFPPNGKWLITYPTSGDLTLDSQSPDTFQKFQLIRLPAELGGSNPSAAAFVAFSKVCVHLWCSPNYDPQKSTDPTYETYQCPCHGSIYQLPQKDANGNLVDGGKAIAGPAALQPAPTNAIPMLTLTADSNGDLWIEIPVWDVDHDGVIGYGRNYQSYQDYILPAAQGKGT